MASQPGPFNTVFITGISPTSHLSKQIAHSFAQAGASNIALLGPDIHHLDSTAAELRAAYPAIKFLAIAVDLTAPESVGLISHQIRAELGAWDVFIHNAPAFVGEPSSRTSIRGADDEDWWAFFERNVRGLQFVARHFFTKMRGVPTFINLVPAGCEVVADDRNAAASVSCFAGARVVEFLAVENERMGLKAVNVATAYGRGGGDEDGVKKVAEFLVWCVSKRQALGSGARLDADVGVDGYEEADGKLRKKSGE